MVHSPQLASGCHLSSINNQLNSVWEPYKKGFKAFLQLERSLSDNTISAYLNDLGKLTTYLLANGLKKNPSEVQLVHLQKFIQWIAELGMTATTSRRTPATPSSAGS